MPGVGLDMSNLHRYIYSTLYIYNYMFTFYRSIADEHRSLGLGIQSVFFRILGAIPGPIVMGALFDASCEFWEEQCGERGNCWVYNNEDLSLRIFGVIGSARIVSVICAICICVFFDVTLCKRNKPETSAKDNSSMSMVDSYLYTEFKH